MYSYSTNKIYLPCHSLLKGSLTIHTLSYFYLFFSQGSIVMINSVTPGFQKVINLCKLNVSERQQYRLYSTPGRQEKYHRNAMISPLMFTNRYSLAIWNYVSLICKCLFLSILLIHHRYRHL